MASVVGRITIALFPPLMKRLALSFGIASLTFVAACQTTTTLSLKTTPTDQQGLSSLPEPGPTAAIDTSMEFPGGMNRALDLSPDGSMVAYAVRPAGDNTDGVITLWVQPLVGGQATALAGTLSVDVASWGGQEARLRWSPNGRHLAYFATEDDKFYLHVWHRGSGEVEVFRTRSACAGGPCYNYEIQWAPDSNVVYFLAEDEREAALGRYKLTGGSGINMRQQLLFTDPENNGVTVRSFPAVTTPKQKDVSAPVLADVAAANITNGQVTNVLSGTAARYFALAPDGRSLLAAVELKSESEIRQAYRDFFLVTLPTVHRERQTGTDDGVRDWRGEEVAPTLRKVKMWQAKVSWSPQSNRLVFAEHGALSDGDIYLLEVSNGKARNLTQELEISLADTPLINRLFDYAGKFGHPYRSVIWSSTGDMLYAQRTEKSGAIEMQQLWAISASTGQADNLTPNAVFLYNYLLHNNGVASIGRGPGSLVLSAKIGEGKSGFIEIDPSTSQVTLINSFPGDAANHLTNISRSAQGGKVVFLNESVDQPQEIYALDLYSQQVTQITQQNSIGAKSETPKRQLISWQLPDGQPGQGYLYLPANYKRENTPAGLPVIMQVYPGMSPTRRYNNQYRGQTDQMLNPLPYMIRAGYAVLMPDLAVAGGGETCRTVANHVEAALEAAAEKGEVDRNRAAVIGHSFGGWAVNCVVTHTDRFKAAVAVAGNANLISSSFDPQAKTWGLGGGQTKIGKSIWEAPELFWKESPVSGLRRVTTPLLLIHGKEDQAVPFQQSVEMYVGLSGLGKTVMLVGYDGGDHYNVIERPDYKKRVIEWIDHYLQGDLPIDIR